MNKPNRPFISNGSQCYPNHLWNSQEINELLNMFFNIGESIPQERLSSIKLKDLKQSTESGFELISLLSSIKLSLQVHICVCVSVSVYLCVCLCLCLCLYVYAYVCLCLTVFVSVCVFVCVFCTSLCLSVCVYVCLCYVPCI